MSDLTKLTADELRVRFDVLRPKMNVPSRLVLAEISRRLERLEQCEAAQEAVLIGGNHLASVLIGRLGAHEDKFPPYHTPIEDAQKVLYGDDLDIWFAWRAIMLMRDAARAALEEE